MFLHCLFCFPCVHWEDKYHSYSSSNDLIFLLETFMFFSLYSQFMGISWWVTLIWVIFFFHCTLSLVYSFYQKTQILLLWNVYLYYFNTLLPPLSFFFFFNFYFWNSYYLLGWFSKFLNFSLYFSGFFCGGFLFCLFYFYFLLYIQENFSNFIFQPSFIFLLSYFKLPRILLVLNCSFH